MVWRGTDAEKECWICGQAHTLLLPIHHCRNCGFYVCTNCSCKPWPSGMLPHTYHFQEAVVRVCDTCSLLSDNFYHALRSGDLQLAIAAFTSGNVNLHTPFSLYVSSEYPVHSAAIGGNVDIMKWLVEGRQCTLVDNKSGSPIRTKEGFSVLDLAAHYGHEILVKYLISLRQFSRSDIDRAKSICLYVNTQGPIEGSVHGELRVRQGSLVRQPSSSTPRTLNLQASVTDAPGPASQNMFQVQVDRWRNLSQLHPKFYRGKKI